jgi:hypothetical protein
MASIGDEIAGCAPAPSSNGARHGTAATFQESHYPARTANLVCKEARKKASELLPGPEKDELLKKAQQADSAAHLDKWVNSPGLQPPD